MYVRRCAYRVIYAVSCVTVTLRVVCCVLCTVSCAHDGICVVLNDLLVCQRVLCGVRCVTCVVCHAYYNIRHVYCYMRRVVCV